MFLIMGMLYFYPKPYGLNKTMITNEASFAT